MSTAIIITIKKKSYFRLKVPILDFTGVYSPPELGTWYLQLCHPEKCRTCRKLLDKPGDTERRSTTDFLVKGL